MHAAWSGAIGNAVANARLTISSTQQTISAQSIPVNGLVQVDYNAPQNKIAFGQSYLQTANTKVAIGGTLSSRRGGQSQLAVEATTSDLREITTLAAILQAAMQPSQPAAKIPELAGAANLNARVTGTAKDPRIQAQVNAQNLVVNGSKWNSLVLAARGNSSELVVENGTLKAAGNEQINFSGKAGLQDWSLVENSPVELQASFANMPAQTAEEIAQVRYPVAESFGKSFGKRDQSGAQWYRGHHAIEGLGVERSDRQFDDQRRITRRSAAFESETPNSGGNDFG